MLLGLLVLSGCATAPSSTIKQPLTARPQPSAAPLVANGTIFQAGYNRLYLFEDRRARNIGDTLTVVINEKNSASSQASTNDTHSGSAKLTMSPNIFAGQSTNTTLLDASSATKYDDKGQNANANTFTGTVTVTVLEVLSNGNLVVSGEKQVSVGDKTEFLRLAGVVNPNYISSTNTVNSVQLADAHIEFKDNHFIDPAKLTSMLARFFLSVMF
ncbi:MAG: flagellar basal body L-ring protein FlgH [Sulfuricella sp.]|nr:flagellar basal body L-ring protein FlgH [Sulfuricella sp.]